MKMVSLILPLLDNENLPIPHAHDFVRRMFAKEFEGWTQYPVQGGWVNEGGSVMLDSSMKYEVAVPSGYAQLSYSIDHFRQIAMEAGHLGRQKAIFITIGNEAEIIQLV